MERLSRPLGELQVHYDAVVVGSGYGGGVAASRLARTGRRVCVLERGREMHPGEYPRTLRAAAGHIQLTTAAGQVGDPRNLYAFHLDGDINVFSGCGLGGTSLVNANVSLRPDPRVFADTRWPAELRSDGAGLDVAFGRAEAMLRPATYPSSYPPLAKIDALRRAAGETPCELTPINVTFRAGPNAAGVHQEACNGCGDCVTGCNYGAKNTVLMTYLPDAVAFGAAVFCEVEARWVERAGDRWVVRAQPLDDHRDDFAAPPLAVSADVVVLAAGTVGTTGILLRSRARGLPASDQLGNRFTGNGDVLGFAYDTAHVVRGMGSGPDAPDPHSPPGPCITAVVDGRGAAELDDAMIVEDAVIPGAVASLVPAQLAFQAVPRWLGGRLRHGRGIWPLVRSMLTRGRRGALARTQTFLLMGHDDDEGRIVLDGDHVRIRWKGAGTRPFYERANRVLAAAAARTGGTYLHNPAWTRELGHELMTVHPLGGCAMADRAEDGVVDHKGRVYAAAQGTAVHDGLYVADGAVMARPLGVNPLLTITALAERCVAGIAADRGWVIEERPLGPAPVPAPAPAAPPRVPGLRFTEKMSGWCAVGDGGRPAAGVDDIDVFDDAAATGRAAGTALTFVLTMTSDDVRATAARPDRPMAVTGTVTFPPLGTEPLTVRDGHFQLLVADAGSAVRHMWYRLPLEHVDGSSYHLEGFKVVRPGAAGDLWPDTTTLYTTLRRDAPDGPVAARGVLRIAAADFARQARSMQVTGPVGEWERLQLEARFGEAFAGALFHAYGTVIHRSTRLRRHAPPRRHRPLRVPAPVVHPYTAADGTGLRLTRYRGGDRGPVIVTHGMGANPLTFTTDTVGTNLVEFLTAAGHDVWVQEWRGSTLLPTDLTEFTADDAAHLDHRAAEAAVRALSGRDDLHWVTHCVGSVTVAMATLAGSITPASLLLSQAGLHPVGPLLSRLKGEARLARVFRELGVRRLTTDSYDDESLPERALDAALRLYPIPRAERCDSAVCRRLAFIYGVATHHRALDDTTHGALHELFGPTNMTMMAHLSRIAVAERLVDAHGRDVYLPHLDRLRLPITWVHGAHNLVWLPESTRRDIDLLSGRYGPQMYRRIGFRDHGHQDCFIGRRCAEPGDVFDAVAEHLDRAGA